MSDILKDPVFLALCAAIIILVVIIAVGSRRHVHKDAFKPTFERSGDGSLRMVCAGFGGLQSARSRRFYEQYKVGMRVFYQNKPYTITGFEEVFDKDALIPDLKIIAYLEEV